MFAFLLLGENLPSGYPQLQPVSNTRVKDFQKVLWTDRLQVNHCIDFCMLGNSTAYLEVVTFDYFASKTKSIGSRGSPK